MQSSLASKQKLQRKSRVANSNAKHTPTPTATTATTATATTIGNLVAGQQQHHRRQREPLQQQEVAGSISISVSDIHEYKNCNVGAEQLTSEPASSASFGALTKSRSSGNIDHTNTTGHKPQVGDSEPRPTLSGPPSIEFQKQQQHHHTNAIEVADSRLVADTITIAAADDSQQHQLANAGFDSSNITRDSCSFGQQSVGRFGQKLVELSLVIYTYTYTFTHECA